MEEVKIKPKNCTLIIFTCFIKTCLQTKNIQEALSTYDSLKSFGIQPDQITYNTLLKGLVINKAYEQIPNIIEDSLRNHNTLCSVAIYSEAVNTLDKNISKTNLKVSDTFEIRRKLALRNIYVVLASNTENKNNFSLENDNYSKKNGKSEMNYNCNLISSLENNNNSNNVQSEYNSNYSSNRKNKYFRNFKKEKPYKNFNNENINKDNSESYIDNYDFLLNGYKNNKKHFNPNYQQNNNNYNHHHQNKNSTNKKISNRQTFNFINESNLNIDSSEKVNKDENQIFLDIYPHNNSQTKNLFNNNFKQESELDIKGGKNEDQSKNFMHKNDDQENSIYDKSSLEYSNNLKISSMDNTGLSILKPTENKLIESNNIENTNSNNNGANKLKERSSFYKNFANFNDFSNNTKLSKNFQFYDHTKNIHNYKRERFSNDIFDKIAFTDNNERTIDDAEKQNYLNADKNQFKGSNTKKYHTKNSNNTYLYDNKNDHNVHWYSNANKTQNNFSTKNQIIRKGFNLPLGANSEKVVNENYEYSFKENDENSYSKNNDYSIHKPQKKNAHNFKRDIYLNNNAHYNQQVVNLKKLTRF